MIFFCFLLLKNIFAHDHKRDGVDIPDPLEGLNRIVFVFNDLIDGLFFKPISILYNEIMPECFKESFQNINANLKEATNVVFYLFQGDPHRSLKSIGRFMINTTAGLGGIFDFAKKIDLNHEPTSMNETLIKWGVGSGFYVVVPFFGPSSLRGVSALTIDTFGDPWIYIAGNKKREHNTHGENRVPLYAIYAIDKMNSRVELLGVLDDINKSLDPYSALRSSYTQHQKYIEEKTKRDDHNH
jgi:phospholipid-binding lipoprotein MlaA